jgi:ArsR family transcriptional regulator, arsenate/arsenite/antimonite-responsive transcriptional repressor
MVGGGRATHISACSEMTEQTLSSTAAAAKALGHPARLRLLATLSGGPLCVCQMTAVLGTASSTVSEHLRELRRAGLIVEEKDGKFVFYRLAASRDAARWLQVIRAGLAGDPVAAADAELVARLRRVPVEEFAASGGRLPAASGSRARRSVQRRA